MSINPFMDAYKGLRREITLIASVELKKHRIGQKQMSILFHLEETPSITPTQLAFQTQSDPAAVTRALQSMEKAGLVRKKADALDNRRVLHELTAKGRAKAQVLEGVRQEILQRIKKTVSAAELKELTRLMQLVADDLARQRG